MTKTTIVSNIPSSELYYACTEIAEILKKFCGPYAQHALIYRGPQYSTSNVASNIDEYSKDGITIVDALRSDTFATEIALRLIDNIGKKIDMTVNDGTTTAMLWFTLIVKHWENNFPRENEIPRINYVREFNKFMDKVIDKFTNLVPITIDRLMEQHKSTPGFENVTERDWNRFIAYHSALISSKGDVELAKCISDIVYQTPTEALVESWRTAINREETEAGYEICSTEYDVEIENCNFAKEGKSYLNTEHDTIGIYDNSNVVFSSLEIMEGGLYTDFITALIGAIPNTTYSEEELNRISFLRQKYGMPSNPDIQLITRPTFVFTKKRASRTLASLVDAFALQTGIEIVIVQYQLESNNTKIIKLHSSVINSMGLAIPLDSSTLSGVDYSDYCIMRNVDVRLHTTTIDLRFNNVPSETEYQPLFKMTLEEAEEAQIADTLVYNYYHNTLKETKTFVNFVKNHHLTRYSAYETQLINDLYFSMISRKRLALKVYGMAHSSYASSSVIQDSFGSAYSSIVDGFVISGYVSLLSIVNNTTPSNILEEFSKNVLQKSLLELLSTIYGFEIKTMDCDEVTNFNDTSYLPEEVDFIPCKIKKSGWVTDASSVLNFEDDTNTYLIQPSKAFYWQMVRYKDMSKLMNTSTIINPMVERVVHMKKEQKAT